MAAFLPSHRSPSAAIVALLIVGYALVSRVEFEVGTGCTVPTQLVFVPMLFGLPAGAAPLCVAAGYVLGNLVDHLRGRRHAERSFVLIASSWYSVGPALVLALAGERAPGWSDWPLYVGAFAAQVAFEFASSTAREHLAFRVSPRELLRPLAWIYLVDALLSPIGLVVAVAGVETPQAFLLVLPTVGLLTIFARERRGRLDNALELSSAYRGTALLLGDVIESDDAYTGSHSRDVVGLVLEVADALGIDPRERRRAEFAALLHDVGKIAIPKEIINKPGPLTREERAIVEMHTIEGQRVLEKVGGVLGEVGRIVRSCHEWFDGGGYPDGLRGEEIPLVARIVCCCDAFSAMTTDRPYRSARRPDEAVGELKRCAGTQFDPSVVHALAAIVESMSLRRIEPGKNWTESRSEAASASRPSRHRTQTEAEGRLSQAT